MISCAARGGGISCNFFPPFPFHAYKKIMEMGKVLFACLLLAANHLVAQEVAAANKGDVILGTWLTDTKDSKIEIYKSGEHYFGKLIWADEMFEADGKTSKKDTRNPDSNLQSRALQNL